MWGCEKDEDDGNGTVVESGSVGGCSGGCEDG